MTLVIEPTTEKGKTQIETIKWCEDQLNAILEAYFKGKYRIQKGMRLEFKIPTTGNMETVKVDLLELAPPNKERFDEAVKEAEDALAFETKNPEIPEPEKEGDK